MRKIDEIMGAIGRHGDDCIRDADAASESFEALRELIAAALAAARREGAEQMRAECLTCCAALEDSAWKQYKPSLGGTCDPHHQGRSDGAAEVSAAIRALPLPAGERQVEQPEADAWECRSGGLKPLSQRLYDRQPDKIKRHYTRIKPAVLLTPWQFADALGAVDAKWFGDQAQFLQACRAIETAVLAANNLEVRRG